MAAAVPRAVRRRSLQGSGLWESGGRRLRGLRLHEPTGRGGWRGKVGGRRELVRLRRTWEATRTSRCVRGHDEAVVRVTVGTLNQGILFYSMKTMYTYDVSRPHGERHLTPPHGWG
jgi:hypothetical protein